MSPRHRIPLAALALTAALAPAAGAAVPDASFYSPADGSIPAAHGKLMRAERISGGSLPRNGKSYLVLYSSRSPSGEPVAVSGTVTLPKGPAPRGGFPVVSWAHGTTGIADACAPSKYATSAPTSEYARSFRRQASRWLDKGWVVAQTDYQGLGTPGLHPYLIGTAEGRSVIDIVSAARQIGGRVGRRWAAIGHSQGGHAALWAAAIAKRYAPRLRLQGAVPIAPASHIGEQAALIESIDGNPFGGLPALIVAAGAADAGLDPAAVFSDAALALYPQIEQVCLGELSGQDSFGGLSLKAHFREGFDTTALRARIAANDPEDLTIRVPLLIAQGRKDTTVLPFFTDDTVEQLRGRGTKITYRNYKQATHVSVAQESQRAADRFLARLFG